MFGVIKETNSIIVSLQFANYINRLLRHTISNDENLKILKPLHLHTSNTEWQ
jgi:hypothetical protein